MHDKARFACDLRSVRSARAWLASHLADRSPTAWSDDALLCISELTSNAVRHARSDFTVAVSDGGGALRIEVGDASDGHPRVVATDPGAETGRGMLIVDAVADRWGVTANPGGGKTVWCELDPSDRVHRVG